jgi:hypothetical protein
MSVRKFIGCRRSRLEERAGLASAYLFRGSFVMWLLVGGIVLATACGPKMRACSNPECGPSEGSLTVNGRVISFTEATLLDVLLTKTDAARLFPGRIDGEPLVVIDGIVAPGTRRLADVPAAHVLSVTLMRSPEAVYRYGSSGYYGAIVVTMKRR